MRIISPVVDVVSMLQIIIVGLLRIRSLYVQSAGSGFRQHDAKREESLSSMSRLRCNDWCTTKMLTASHGCHAISTYHYHW
jgi:hypothetical protein